MSDVSSLLRLRPQIYDLGFVRVAYLRNASYLTTAQIFVGAGSSVEKAGEYGIAHILEHMFFKGSKKRPGGTSIPRAANDIGASMNAYTSYDHTAYYITALNDSFEEGFDILGDMFRNPLFPEEEFRKELNPILSEFREREDDPDDFLHERAMERYYGPGYHPIIGTEQSILASTTDLMHAFKNLYYGAGNVLIVIVGGIEEDRMLRAVHALFSDMPEAKRPVFPQLKARGGDLELKRTGIQEACFNLYYPALPQDHPERHHEDLMNFILGGNDSSLLFERIREELGLSCYGIYSSIARTESFNNLNISCGIDPTEIDILETEIHNIILKLCEERLEEHHLRRAKASIRTLLASRAETSKGLASMIALPVLRRESEDPLQKALNEIEEVTIDDIREAAQHTFSGPCLRAVLLPDSMNSDEEED
jgi:predicted Zn-dependent peptidase